jgi:hypothetical protein
MAPLLSESALLVLLAATQILGLSSLACVRLRGDSLLHRFFRGTFMLALLAVGLATLGAVACGSGWWVSCGTTLSLMSVGGTIDLGHSSSAAL